MLSYLQHGVSLHGHNSDIILPSDNFDISSFSYGYTSDKDDNHSIASTQCVYTIRGSPSGIWHVTNILSMLVDISVESASSYNATAAFQDYLAWLLESFLSTHEMTKRLQSDPTLQEVLEKCWVMSFCSVQALISCLRNQLSGGILRKGHILLSIFCVDLIKIPANLSDDTIIKLCSSLLSLIRISKEYESMRQVLSLHLGGALLDTLADESACNILGTDFQVSFCFYPSCPN